MTSHHQPSKGRARVMWAHPTVMPDDGWPRLSAFSHSDGTSYPVLLLRCLTLKQARALKRFFDLSEEEKVERIAKRICDLSRNWKGAWDNDYTMKDGYRMDALAVLAAMEGGV